MNRIKSLLVGTGSWAETHAKAYQLSSEVEIVGVCGHSNMERLDHVADTYGIPYRSTDLEGLIRETKPDILDVACNPQFRLEGVQAAMVPSIRLINLEKPLALAPRDAYEIERLCVENRKLLTVNHQTKFIPSWKKARLAIADGRIGDVLFIRSSCQGNLLEQGTHLVDATMSFVDYSPLRWVMGQVDELEGFDKESAGAPDAATATLCFENGVRAVLDFGSAGAEIPGEGNKWHNYWSEVYGTKGHIRITLNKTMETVIYDGGPTEVEESSWDKHFIQAEAEHLDKAACYACDPEKGHMSDLRNSMASFNAIMAIYASASGEGRVELPRRFDDDVLTRLRSSRDEIE
jgi:predicted dehydrogenase